MTSEIAASLKAFSLRPEAPIGPAARIAYQRRRIAALQADIETMSAAACALLSELHPILPVLPAAWDELADVVGWTKDEVMHG